MNKKYFFLRFVFLFFASSTCGESTTQTSNQHQLTPLTTNKKILLVHVTDGFGGAEVHKIELYKQLLKHEYQVDLLVAKHSPMAKILHKLKLPYLITRAQKLYPVKTFFKKRLGNTLKYLHKKQRYDIIQCSTEYEVWAAQQLAKKHPVKIVFERHISNPIRHAKTFLVDGIIAVSKPITQALLAKAQELGAQTHITHIPAFFNYDKFLNFIPTQKTKYDFFKDQFGLDLPDEPIIVMIAQMHKDLLTKNHLLLFKAIHKLVYKKKKPVQVLLVGHGPSLNIIKKLAYKLRLQNYVHFLGFTNQTPAILHYADMHVLSSSKEALGLVSIEASLMKKPIIAATATGAVDIIQHGYNGFLFKNNDVDDLVEKIETLVDNEVLRQKMGANAFKHVLEDFSLEKNIEKLLAFYDKMYTETIVSMQ